MYTFNVNDMSCGGCAAAITASIQRTDPQAVVQTDPVTKVVTVESREPASTIIEAITDAGYHVAQ